MHLGKGNALHQGRDSRGFTSWEPCFLKEITELSNSRQCLRADSNGVWVEEQTWYLLFPEHNSLRSNWTAFEHMLRQAEGKEGKKTKYLVRLQAWPEKFVLDFFQKWSYTSALSLRDSPYDYSFGILISVQQSSIPCLCYRGHKRVLHYCWGLVSLQLHPAWRQQDFPNSSS